MNFVFWCVVLVVLGFCSVQGLLRLGSSDEEDDITSFYDLADPAEFDELSRVNSHTSGFLLAKFKDLGANPKTVVEVEVLHIGVCYQTKLSPPEFTKLIKVVVNKDTKEVTLTRQSFTDADCTNKIDHTKTDTVVPLREKVQTSHGVEITIKRKFTESEEKALTPPQELGKGSIVSFFGVETSCAGEPFKFLLLTDKCSNYLIPDFFGRVRCSKPNEELTFEEHPFNDMRNCPGLGTDLKTQPFGCSNQGTGEAPDYQTAACLPPAKAKPAPLTRRQ